jgi:hypothetical protein
MTTIYRGIRRKVCLYLVDRIDISFPEDWDSSLTVRDVVRLWLKSEGDLR